MIAQARKECLSRPRPPTIHLVSPVDVACSIAEIYPLHCKVVLSELCARHCLLQECTLDFYITVQYRSQSGRTPQKRVCIIRIKDVSQELRALT